MYDSVNKVFEIGLGVINKIKETQTEKLDAAGRMIAKAHLSEHKFFVTGSGHSHTVAEERDNELKTKLEELGKAFGSKKKEEQKEKLSFEKQLPRMIIFFAFSFFIVFIICAISSIETSLKVQTGYKIVFLLSSVNVK